MFIDFINQNIIWFVAWAVLFNLVIFSFLRGGVSGANFVSALELPSLQRGGKSIVIDVNKPDQFSASHIPSAINIPVEDIDDTNKELLKSKSKTVILTCQTGSRSQSAAKKLVSMGFTNVNILRGGLIAWTKENLPVASAQTNKN